MVGWFGWLSVCLVLLVVGLFGFVVWLVCWLVDWLVCWLLG